VRLMLFSIEINLILWLAVVGALFADPSDAGLAGPTAIVGCGFAAVIQHWAYHNIRKKPK
jgi:hypothetical protein